MRKIITVSMAAVAATGLYLGWTFHLRSKGNQELTRRLKAPAEERDRAIREAYGGGIKIASFYAVPSGIRPGETAQLCYSVVSADKVRIEPPPKEETWPSRSRCVAVSPGSDTTYRLTAEDAEGNSKTADLTVTVR
ncbi:MAG: hypothetical protein QUT30_03450 [Acidobacteriota bacterium]|jgi:hypothetical protein|nr:hypothetical protein [Acidobacteriota bacterium]